MKFHDLAIGQRFELEGALYVKTSPVLASREGSGESRFMARYVVVQTLDSAEHPAKMVKDQMLREEVVLAAFDVFYVHCREALEQFAGDVPASKLDALMGTVEEGRKAFLDALLKQ